MIPTSTTTLAHTRPHSGTPTPTLPHSPRSHLVLHEQVGVVPLLVAGRLEELGKPGQRHVVAVEVGVQRVVHVAHVVLHAAWGGGRGGKRGG